MELNNILQVGMILKIDKFYGEILIEIQICINLLQLSTKQEKNIKYGIKHKFKDMLILKYLHIQKVKC